MSERSQARPSSSSVWPLFTGEAGEKSLLPWTVCPGPCPHHPHSSCQLAEKGKTPRRGSLPTRQGGRLDPGARRKGKVTSITRTSSFSPTCLVPFPASLPPNKPVIIIHFLKPYCWASSEIAASSCPYTGETDVANIWRPGRPGPA